jgi:hypothetical protein
MERRYAMGVSFDDYIIIFQHCVAFMGRKKKRNIEVRIISDNLNIHMGEM